MTTFHERRESAQPPHRRSCFARLRDGLQDRLWARDEAWAAERGLIAERSPSGWSIRISDPRTRPVRHEEDPR